MLLMNHRHVDLMDNILVLLVYDRLVNLGDALLVDHWLDVLMDHRLVVLMDHLLVVLYLDILMMFMQYIPLMFFDYGLLEMGLYKWSLLMDFNSFL